jgi:hypothetical protein
MKFTILTSSFIALGMGSVWAQPAPAPAGQAAAQAQAHQPAAPSSPGQNSLNEAMRRFGQLNDDMTRSLKEMEANREQMAQSEQFVDQLLDQMNEAVDRGSPDGDIANALRQVIREAMNEASQARARGSENLARQFDAQAAEFQTRLSQLNSMFRDARDRAQIVAAARADLAAQRRRELFAELNATVSRMFDAYRSVAEEVRRMQESLSRGAGS